MQDLEELRAPGQTQSTPGAQGFCAAKAFLLSLLQRKLQNLIIIIPLSDLPSPDHFTGRNAP